MLLLFFSSSDPVGDIVRMSLPLHVVDVDVDSATKERSLGGPCNVPAASRDSFCSTQRLALLSAIMLSVAFSVLYLALSATASPFHKLKRWEYEQYYDVQGHRGARGQSVESVIPAFAMALIVRLVLLAQFKLIYI